MYGRPGILRREVLLSALCVLATATAFDMIQSGAQGLSPACQSVIDELQRDMGRGNISAITTAMEARYAAGHVIEGLFVVNANARAPALTPEQQKAALVPLVSGYPWSSPGNADACSYIRKDRGAAADFQYCYLDVLYAFLRLGMCVPKACGPEDIALGLNAAFTKTTNMKLDSKLQLAPMTVCGSPRFPYVAGTYVMIVVTLMLLVLVAVGTAVEWLTGPGGADQTLSETPSGPMTVVSEPSGHHRWRLDAANPKALSVLKCFSLIQNWRLLTAGARGGPFDALDGIRTLSIGWVALGHSFAYTFYTANFSNVHELWAADNKGMLARYSMQPIPGSFYAVESFFFLSAFLAVYLMMEQVTRLKQTEGGPWHFVFKAPYIYGMRYLRLTPAYIYVLMMYWFVVRLAGSGPLWKATLDVDYKLCSEGWWTNLIYINNLVTTRNPYMEGQQCFPISWYLAIDFQLFLLTPFIAAAGVWNHIATLALLGLSCLLSAGLAILYAYKNAWSTVSVGGSDYIKYYYMAPWFRAPPYLIGMMLAIVWYHYHRGTSAGNMLLPRASSSRCNRLLVYSLFAASFVLMGSTLYGGQGAFTDIPPSWSKATMSMYIGLSKPAWTIGLALMCYLLFLGEGGVVKTFLECHAFTVLSRLTYCVYLVHVIIIYWLSGELLGPVHYSNNWLALMYSGLITMAMAVATVLHLLVERPMTNLVGLACGRAGEKGKDTDKQLEMVQTGELTATHMQRPGKVLNSRDEEKGHDPDSQ